MAQMIIESVLPAEELPQIKNTFIDYPPQPMAQLPVPTSSAPAFLQRFQKRNITPPSALLQGHAAQSKRASFCSTDSPGSAGSTDGKSDVSSDCESQEEKSFELPSIGSATHTDGSCNPCAWYWKASGCKIGQGCNHCHLCPEGATKAKKKAKLAILKAATAVEPPQEPAYVSLQDEVLEESIEAPVPVEKASVRFAETDDVLSRMGPVKVTVANTFIQLEIPSSPRASSNPPLRSTPGDYFKRLFRTQAEPTAIATPPSPVVADVAESFLRSDASVGEEVDTEEEKEVDVLTSSAPVNVTVKNTFIQLDVPRSPNFTSAPPLRSTPGDYFQRLFRTTQPAQPLCADPAVLTPRSDVAFDNAAATHFPPTPSHDTYIALNDLVVGHAEATASAAMAVRDTELAASENLVTGNQAHFLGQCTPCNYFYYKKDGCRLGAECKFCHLCEKGELKKRKKDRLQKLKDAGLFVPGFGRGYTESL